MNRIRSIGTVLLRTGISLAAAMLTLLLVPEMVAPVSAANRIVLFDQFANPAGDSGSHDIDSSDGLYRRPNYPKLRHNPQPSRHKSHHTTGATSLIRGADLSFRVVACEAPGFCRRPEHAGNRPLAKFFLQSAPPRRRLEPPAPFFRLTAERCPCACPRA